MYLEVFADNPFGTNCWLLARQEAEDAIVIDPGFEPYRVIGLLQAAGKRPAAVLCTHGHFDHVGAAADICGDELRCYVHSEDEQAFIDAEGWGSTFPVAPPRPKLLEPFGGGDVLRLAGMELDVLHTPGHTPGSSCFRLGDLFFSGDLVFRGSIGRYDFPNSRAQDMFASLRRFLSLPDHLEVRPGHGESTTVGLERAANPFLRQLA